MIHFYFKRNNKHSRSAASVHGYSDKFNEYRFLLDANRRRKNRHKQREIANETPLIRSL